MADASVHRRKRARTSPSGDAHHVSLDGGEVQQSHVRLMRRQQELCDIVLRIHGNALPAHRLVLAGSGYFRTLFQQSMRDSSSEHSLEGVSPAAMTALVDFLYNGRVLVEESLLVEMLEAACRFQVEALQTSAEQALIYRLSADSCVGAWQLAQAHHLADLKAAARAHSLVSFAALVENGHLAAIPYELLHSMLREDSLTASSEAAIFDAVASWIGSQQPPPAEAATMALLKQIRFSLIPSEAMDRIRRCPLVTNTVLTAVEAALKVRHDARKQMGASVLYVVADGTAIFQLMGDTWQKISEMGVVRLVSASAGKLHAIRYGNGRIQSFDRSSSVWTQGPQLVGEPELCWKAATQIGGELYVLTDAGDALVIINMATAKWRCSAPLPTPIDCFYASPRLVADSEQLYVISNEADGTELSVAIFDTRTGSWSEGRSGGTARDCPCAAALGGVIYIVGGLVDDDGRSAQM